MRLSRPAATHFRRSRWLAVALCLALLTGCNLIYKQNVQQGNAIEQEDLDQLTLGMTKNQVVFLLGSPAIRDPFNRDRWDYVNTFSRRGGDPLQRTVTLWFENDRLVRHEGVEDDLAELSEESIANQEIEESELDDPGRAEDEDD